MKATPISSLPHRSSSNAQTRRRSSRRLLLLLLQVLVAKVGNGTANGQKGVQANTQARSVGLRLGRNGARAVARRARVAGLPLQCADEQLLQSLARLVAVADILECLGGVLAADVQQDLLAAAIRGLVWIKTKRRQVDGEHTGAHRQTWWSRRPCRG